MKKLLFIVIITVATITISCKKVATTPPAVTSFSITRLIGNNANKFLFAGSATLFQFVNDKHPVHLYKSFIHPNRSPVTSNQRFVRFNRLPVMPNQPPVNPNRGFVHPNGLHVALNRLLVNLYTPSVGLNELPVMRNQSFCRSEKFIFNLKTYQNHE